jgi:hypothetical protein
MANKVFVSYKYNDDNVFALKSEWNEMSDPTTVRSYVSELEDRFNNSGYVIYKGESDGEDLSKLSEDQIWEKLKDRINDSTVTIVMISPRMKESNRRDRSQWIPWEISYSLKEPVRNDRTSHSNAILALVLPHLLDSYEYFISDRKCCNYTCRSFNTNCTFDILRDNMSNKINKTEIPCKQGLTVYSGGSSYIKVVKWSDFIENSQEYIKRVIEIKENINDYKIRKEP